MIFEIENPRAMLVVNSATARPAVTLPISERRSLCWYLLVYVATWADIQRDKHTDTVITILRRNTTRQTTQDGPVCIVSGGVN